MSRTHRTASTSHWVRGAVASAMLGLAGCASPPASIPAPVPGGVASAEVPVKPPAPPAELERHLADEPIELRAVGSSGAGTLRVLVEHRDGRGGNILVSKVPEDRRVFAVDNGIAFGARIHNWFVPNWNVIRVPAFPRNEIDRLRRVGRGARVAPGWLQLGLTRSELEARLHALLARVDRGDLPWF